MAEGFLGLSLGDWIISGVSGLDHMRREQEAIRFNQRQWLGGMGLINDMMMQNMGIGYKGIGARGRSPMESIQFGQQTLGRDLLEDYKSEKPLTVFDADWWFGPKSLFGQLGQEAARTGHGGGWAAEQAANPQGK